MLDDDDDDDDDDVDEPFTVEDADVDDEDGLVGGCFWIILPPTCWNDVGGETTWAEVWFMADLFSLRATLACKVGVADVAEPVVVVVDIVDIVVVVVVAFVGSSFDTSPPTTAFFFSRTAAFLTLDGSPDLTLNSTGSVWVSTEQVCIWPPP